MTGPGGSTDRNLGNWLVRDLANRRYRLPADFTLKAGRYVRIHTGKGTDDGNDLYWGRGWVRVEQHRRPGDAQEQGR